jgi:uncharacterized protein (TIGR02594 family)
MIQTSAYKVAKTFLGTKELAGNIDNPLVLYMLQKIDRSIQHDETPWCSAFANFIAGILELPQSKALNARSWLAVGQPVLPENAQVDCDVIIVKQAVDDPGPQVTAFRGHVGFFGGWVDAGRTRVNILAGNQHDGSVCVTSWPAAWILGIRRLA